MWTYSLLYTVFPKAASAFLVEIKLNVCMSVCVCAAQQSEEEGGKFLQSQTSHLSLAFLIVIGLSSSSSRSSSTEASVAADFLKAFTKLLALSVITPTHLLWMQYLIYFNEFSQNIISMTALQYRTRYGH